MPIGILSPQPSALSTRYGLAKTRALEAVYLAPADYCDRRDCAACDGALPGRIAAGPGGAAQLGTGGGRDRTARAQYTAGRCADPARALPGGGGSRATDIGLRRAGSRRGGQPVRVAQDRRAAARAFGYQPAP